MTSDSSYTFEISRIGRSLLKTREMIHSILIRHGVDDTTADLVEVAVGEACDNALRHGSSQVDGSSVKLELSIDEGAVRAVVSHTGEAFDFDSIQPFKLDQDFRSYRNGGLGVPLIKALMDEVAYERVGGKTNRLTLVKYLGSTVKEGGG